MEALTQYAVLTASCVTSSAAGYCALKARGFAETVAANETRSVTNRAVLQQSGEFDDVLGPLEQVEGRRSS